jgi:hypothetical protein
VQPAHLATVYSTRTVTISRLPHFHRPEATGPYISWALNPALISDESSTIKKVQKLPEIRSQNLLNDNSLTRGIWSGIFFARVMDATSYEDKLSESWHPYAPPNPVRLYVVRLHRQ